MEITNQIRMIHFLLDEKVTNNFISMLETVYPQESRYVIIGHSETPRLTNIVQNVEYYQIGSNPLIALMSDLSQYQKVYIHYLISGVGYERIVHPNIVWIVWGGDLYESLLCYKGYPIYINENEPLKIKATHTRIGKIPIWLYKIIAKIRDYRNYQKKLKVLKKVRYVSALDEDLALLRKYFPYLKLDKVSGFSYYPIEKQIGEANLDHQCNGLNIWVGNSPALNGNHSTIFNLIKGYPETVKVYCPISYGEPLLISHVDTIGKEILGQRFIPLKEFLPADKYFEKYLDANAFIFGHLRQCGMGSVLMALYFGGKCFLYSESPLYKYFKRNGLIIFSIEKDLCYEATQMPLSKEERRTNREFVKSICSSEAIKKQMKETFS